MVFTKDWLDVIMQLSLTAALLSAAAVMLRVLFSEWRGDWWRTER